VLTGLPFGGAHFPDSPAPGGVVLTGLPFGGAHFLPSPESPLSSFFRWDQSGATPGLTSGLGPLGPVLLTDLSRRDLGLAGGLPMIQSMIFLARPLASTVCR